MKLNQLHKIALFVFSLFLIFVSIVLLIGEYFENTLLSIVMFVSGLYLAYYISLKTFLED